MIGFRTDGIRLMGATEELKDILKQRKLPVIKEVTGNTLVFAINQTEVWKKRVYASSFAAPQAPWFICTVGDFERPSENTLAFATDSDLADFITAIYYAAQGFLHLDFEMASLKSKLSLDNGRKIVALPEERFAEIKQGSYAAVFCFSNGGFMESDRLFQRLTKEFAVDMGEILVSGTFDSKFQFIRAFVL